MAPSFSSTFSMCLFSYIRPSVIVKDSEQKHVPAIFLEQRLPVSGVDCRECCLWLGVPMGAHNIPRESQKQRMRHFLQWTPIAWRVFSSRKPHGTMRFRITENSALISSNRSSPFQCQHTIHRRRWLEGNIVELRSWLKLWKAVWLCVSMYHREVSRRIYKWHVLGDVQSSTDATYLQAPYRLRNVINRYGVVSLRCLTTR